MPIFIKDERAVLFVHVPKTGGTTIERMMAAAGWDMSFRVSPTDDPGQLRYYRVSPQHYHAGLLRRTLRIARFDAVFMLVRDPAARFRSEYAMRNKAPHRGRADLVQSWLDGALERYRQNPLVHDNHLRPQQEFLLPGAEVLKFEDGMPAIVEALDARLDLGLGALGEIPQHMSSSGPRRLASSQVELSPAVRERLREFYAVDYTTFGYDA